MFQPSSGAAQTVSMFNLPSFNQEAMRHILLGDYGTPSTPPTTSRYLATALAKPARRAYDSPGANRYPPGARVSRSAS